MYQTFQEWLLHVQRSGNNYHFKSDFARRGWCTKLFTQPYYSAEEKSVNVAIMIFCLRYMAINVKVANATSIGLKETARGEISTF